ncbi:MAG: hypothetical protein CMB84_01690 [Flammeovirgaceae bacterium]|nr:hypothetical protein [Flammeovirgaceae bacterium]
MRFLFFVPFVLISYNLFPQSFLELGKANSFKTMRFNEGENLRFKKFNEKYFISARISGISDKMIKFNNIEIPVEDIEIIDVREKSSNFMRRFGTYFSGASAGYFLIDFINLSVVQKASAADVYDNKILIGCSVGIGLGFGLRQIKRKYFKRKKLNRIWIQDSF